MRPYVKKHVLALVVIIFVFFILWLINFFVGEMKKEEWIGFGIAAVLGSFILYFLLKKWSFKDAEESLEYRIRLEQSMPKEEPKKEEKKKDSNEEGNEKTEEKEE